MGTRHSADNKSDSRADPGADPRALKVFSEPVGHSCTRFLRVFCSRCGFAQSEMPLTRSPVRPCVWPDLFVSPLCGSDSTLTSRPTPGAWRSPTHQYASPHCHVHTSIHTTHGTHSGFSNTIFREACRRTQHRSSGTVRRWNPGAIQP